MDEKIPAANYQAFCELIGKDIAEWATRAGRTMKFKAPGLMDLCLECIGKHRISMTHYFKMNGDLVPDPDMEIVVDPVAKTALAQAFQDQFGYAEVYPEGVVDLRQYKGQNEFLATWLGNIKDQRFKLAEDMEADE